MKGIITKIIFKTTNFCIFLLENTVIKTNIMISLCELHNYVEVIGNNVVHSKYGNQIIATNIKLLPKTQELIFKCLGGKTAEKLQNEFPDNFLEIIKKEPEKIKNIINNKRIFEKLLDNINKYEELIKDYNSLENYNLPIDILKKLEKKYKFAEIKNCIENNPYKFIKQEIPIEFIDKLQANLPKEYRKEALIYERLLNILKKGGYAVKFVNPQLVEFVRTLDLPHKIDGLRIYKDIILLKKYDKYENIICDFFQKIQEKPIENEPFDLKIEDLAEQQNDYVNMALNNRVSILTGGPGTGKSTTIKFLVKMLLENYGENDILLSAPTGVAANKIKKIVDVENIQGATLHRIIFCGKFEAKVLIIDELSLVGIKLFSKVLKIFPNLEKLILVGDPNQLPSIDAGQLLIDLLKVKKIPNTTLTKIHRQKENSLIVKNAYKILSGDSELIFDDTECCLSSKLEIEKIEPETHIITLTNKTSREINDYIQEFLNPNILVKIQYKTENIKTCYYKLGDKVKHTKNNYDLNVFNGEIGNIIEISEDSLKVSFGYKEILYTGRDLDDLTLAYSTTIHSMQGNEYDTVYINIDDCDKLLNKNVFYTALTRAKKKAIIIGTQKNIDCAVEKEYESRNTTLGLKMNEII